MFRFFPNSAVDEILNEFEKDLIAFHPREALRSVRFIALLLPFEELTEAQITRTFSIIFKVGEFRRISSQFDIFIVITLKKITKYNPDVLKKYDWNLMSNFVFEQILPISLKIPSPVQGARKMTKLLTKSDVELGEEFFETLRKEIPPRIAKWIVYMMQSESYKSAVHEKLLFFLDSLRNLCHPSNYGPWSIQIELFLGYFAGALAKQSNKDEKWLKASSPSLIDEIVEKIWNLSELLVFARSGPALSGLCVSSFTCTNLANVRSDLIIPKMILAISSALESISEPHRTTSAIGLLQVSMPNLMKSPHGIGPVLNLLSTVVFGIDSNDQLKSVRTLSFFLSFSEAAKIQDISGNNFDCLDGWSDVCQEAKELTGQFSDVFLLFTENVISYLRSVSQNSNEDLKGQDDLSRMILAISNCVYAHLSKDIVEICLEKWLELLEEDLGSIVIDIVGEIVSKIASNHFPFLFERLIPKFLMKISDKIDRGDGQLGSKDQSNNALNNNLIVFAHLLENGKVYVSSNLDSVKEPILKLLNSITNRKSFLASSRLIHSLVISLIHFQIKAKTRKIEGNPFESWAQWHKADELQSGEDYEWILPSESDALKALELLEAVLNWSETQRNTLNNPKSKSEIEKIFCLLQVIDNLNIDLLHIYNAFTSYNYGINAELDREGIRKKCQSLLKDNLKILKNLTAVIGSIGNLELEIQLVEIIGSVISGHAVNPDKPREKLKALKRLNINYDRYYTDKHRPISFWLLKAEAQFKLRRDLRFNIGDEIFEEALMKDFDDLAGILYDYCFKPYHKIRTVSQSTLKRFAHRYVEKIKGVICDTFNLVESSDNLTEVEFKGVCFLLRGRFIDFICEDFVMTERFLRCLLKLSDMPIASEVNESFEILSENLSQFIEAYVPDDRTDPNLIKKLAVDLIIISGERDEKWTSQYLAMLSAHPLIESCYCPEIFASLAKLSLSKVSVIRNIAQNCFKSAMYGFIRVADPGLWKYRDISALEMVKRGKLVEIPSKQIKTWTADEFGGFCEFLREYLKFLCLGDEGSGSDGSVQFEFMTFSYLGRWINLLGPAEVSQVIEIINDLFTGKVSMNSGEQRAFCEITCSILCYTKFYDEQVLASFLRKSWNLLAIENLELWTAAIDEPIMWNELVLREVKEFFAAADESSKIILGLKMIYIIYSQIGSLNEWIDIDWLIAKLIKLCSHEYTSIVMESGKLLSFIAIRNPEKREFILKTLIKPSLNRSVNENRSILQFFACSSTIPKLSNYWEILSSNLAILLKMLQSENVQMMTDAKKAILTLFLAKGASLTDLSALTAGIVEFIEGNEPELPVKTSKFCVELIQLLLQNNFSLFHPTGSVEAFASKHVDKLIDSEKVHLRESSHGLILTLYQIDGEKSGKDVEKITKGLQRCKMAIRSERGLKERHSLVIRGSAIILSEPHVISKSLPPLLTALSYYISDRSPISPLVRSTFSEFRRTHQDTWQLDRQLFAEDQLDAIGELLIAPSYYA